jgi:TM2 domain-containing membrane protein YozV
MPGPSLPPPDTAAARQMMLYDANRKSVGVAFLLWVFFGMVGGHRFYLGRIATGVVMLVLTLFSFVLTVVFIGYLGLTVMLAWALIDGFRIPGWVRGDNTRLIARLG